MNKNSINPDSINGLLNVVSKKLGVSPDKLKKELEDGKFDSAIAGMSKSDSMKFQQAIKNPQIVEKLMSTPQAQALYNKLSGK